MHLMHFAYSEQETGMNRLWPRRNPVKDPSSPSTSPTTLPPPSLSRNKPLSPLDLPELLEHVFSFLDHHSLVRVASLVCHRWNTLSKRFLRIVAEMDIASDRERRDAFAAIFPTSTRVILGSSMDIRPNYHFERTRLEQLFQEQSRYKQQSHLPQPLPGSIGSKSATAWAPLQELVLSRFFGDMPTLMSLLPSSTSLTHLELHNDREHYHRLDLGVILHAYPNLLALEVMTTGYGRFIILEPGSTFFEDENIQSPEIPARVGLESIVLRGVTISQPTLQSLLSATAVSLKVLKLWKLKTVLHLPPYDTRTTYSSPFDIPTFLGFLRGLSLRLRSFALSVYEESATEMLIQEMTEQGVLEDFGPDVQEWGFPERFSSVLACVPNRITVLELMKDPGMRLIPRADGLALHEFLCQAPLLLHLKAENIYFDTQYMDLFGPDSLDNPSQRQPSTRGIMEPVGKKTWACVGLKSLSLCLGHPGNGHAFKGRSRRIVFGYLVRFCPQLRELQLVDVFETRFGLEDGWVILSRFKSLERITFSSLNGKSAKALDRFWALVRPRSVEMAQQWYTVRQWKSQLKSETEEIQGRDRGSVERIVSMDDSRESSSSSGSVPWTDVRYLGMLLDVKMALADVVRDSDLTVWWPRIEWIKIRHILSQGTRAVDMRQIETRKPLRYTDDTKAVSGHLLQWE